MFLEPTCKEEALKIIQNCDSKTSCDCNGLDMIMVKNISKVIADPFAEICNKSFEQGIFPDKLKVAKIVPLSKSGDPQVYTNYRPVSLLPQFSKILEKLFNKRLMGFVDKNEILYNGQYGFRKKHSTSLALLDLVEELTSAIDSKKVTIGVFIDLKKAFDTIDHKILLNKLKLYGIRGTALAWLSSYLTNRFQFVQYNNVLSKMLDVVCGVPQGSILGPTLLLKKMWLSMQVATLNRIQWLGPDLK
jgi:hypothetical protein